jgi:hypothetical protein
MNMRVRSFPTIRPRSRAATMLAVTVMLLLTLLPSPASAQIGVTTPLLLNATISPGLAVVNGDGFTPGGLVNIVFTDGNGTFQDQNFWTVASTIDYGFYANYDPAHVYVPAGSVSLAIPLDGSPVYGPNGSQDPAQGYLAGDKSFAFAVCGQDIDVRVLAYDAETTAWSNRVDLVVSDAPCATSTDDAAASAAELPPVSSLPNGRGQPY